MRHTVEFDIILFSLVSIVKIQRKNQYVSQSMSGETNTAQGGRLSGGKRGNGVKQVQTTRRQCILANRIWFTYERSAHGQQKCKHKLYLVKVDRVTNDFALKVSPPRFPRLKLSYDRDLDHTTGFDPERNDQCCWEKG